MNPPSISGLGQVGGFEYVLEALQGQSPSDMAAAMRGLVVAANQRRELTAVFSTFEAETPQIRLDIDRDKTRALNISLSDVFAALQATLGGYYVNDFNLYGRTWTVRMQAEQQFRGNVDEHFVDLCSQLRGRDDADVDHRRRSAGRRTSHLDALQQLPRDLDQRRSGTWPWAW